MNLRTFLMLLLFVAIGLFAVVNWSAFTAPTSLNLLIGTVQAPLGLIMLALTGVLVGLFLVYILYQQAAVIVEARRASRDMATQRDLADKAEASRFTELRVYLESELGKLEARIAEVSTETSSRVEMLERALVAQLTEASNSLAAQLGQIDDKIDRQFAGRG